MRVSEAELLFAWMNLRKMGRLMLEAKDHIDKRANN